MKILAIRGKNLASLSTEFAIDFQVEPLASAGLYAITGPTGAGKSTLLDALCLALYERTPRLAKATTKGESVPDVGDTTVTPSDPRTILRRGAADGYAEVDFQGSDGTGYRSRWSVRRARSKTDGKLQNSDVSLIRIHDGQVLGDHRKTETLRLIEVAIGLNFDQFTRAVLLAQNDFAAFLKASDDERAELLQTLTGTETFAQLSRQAFTRMKAEAEKLQNLRSRLADHAPLAADIRSQKEQERHEITHRVTTLNDQKTTIEGHLRWYQQRDQLTSLWEDAVQKHEQALAARAASASRQVQLALVEHVQPARPLWKELERLTQQAADTEKLKTTNQTALAVSTAGMGKHESAHSAAVSELGAAEASQASAQADINRAKALDASIIALTPQHEAARKAHDDAKQHAQVEQARQADADKRLEQTRADLTSVNGWMEGHLPWRPLAEGWQRWDTLFSQAQAHQAQLDQVNQGLTTQTGTDERIKLEQSRAQGQLDAATVQFSLAETDLQARALACATVDIEKLLHDRQRLEVRRDGIQTATQLWHKRTDIHRQQAHLNELRQAQQALVESCERQLMESEVARPLQEQALMAADRALNLARLAASKNAESMRAALQADQPCPVCGSLDHPYGSHSPVVDAVLDVLQSDVKDKRKAFDQLQQGIATAIANKVTAEQQIQQLIRDLAQRNDELVGVLNDWAELGLREEVEAVPEAGRVEWFACEANLVKAELAALSNQEKAHRAEVQLKDKAQVKLDETKKAVDAAREVIGQLVVQSVASTQAMATLKQQHEHSETQLTQVQAKLDGAFPTPDWRDTWRQDAEAFVAACREQAKTWLNNQGEQTRLSAAIETLKVETQSAKTACDHAAQILSGRAASLAELDAELGQLRDARAVLFGGKSVADVERGLLEAIDLAKLKLVAANDALTSARSENTRLQEAVRFTGAQHDQLVAARDQANGDLDAWLAAFIAANQAQSAASHVADGQVTQPVLTADALKQLLDIPLQWAADERDALQQLDNAVGAELAVKDSRKLTLDAHQATGTPNEPQADLSATLEQSLKELAVAMEQSSNLRLELSLDDERLATSQTLRGEIDKQADVAKVWSQLGDLIGSADGKKFRNFAQQYTLDILLSYGNVHLQSLSRRYRLQRIKDTLGLLVVDLDMGDEVRSVHSLSGGESFLVSLALALGLASLSSHRVKVESLFIDEGFGSLDADSLRVAMDALDNLQAQGRKVGVISHVQDMNERISTRVQVVRQSGGVSKILVS